MNGPSSQLEPSRWVERHGDVLLRYALLHVGDRDRAEERVQEALLAALQSKDGFRGDASERTWLIGILRHKILDHRRRRHRSMPSIEDVAGDRTFTARGDWRERPRPWPTVPAEIEVFGTAFRAALGELEEGLREVFCLRELHGLQTRAICDITGLSPTNLSTRLHRARVRLRAELERRLPDSGGG